MYSPDVALHEPEPEVGTLMQQPARQGMPLADNETLVDVFEIRGACAIEKLGRFSSHHHHTTRHETGLTTPQSLAPPFLRPTRIVLYRATMLNDSGLSIQRLVCICICVSYLHLVCICNTHHGKRASLLCTEA